MSTLGEPFRSKTTTFVPSDLKRSTIAAPMPAAPPVTIAVLPFKPRIYRSSGMTAVASSSILPGWSRRSETKIILMAG
ncbi:hypothetical protein D3C83_107180 [compost metagenome]